MPRSKGLKLKAIELHNSADFFHKYSIHCSLIFIKFPSLSMASFFEQNKKKPYINSLLFFGGNFPNSFHKGNWYSIYLFCNRIFCSIFNFSIVKFVYIPGKKVI